MKNKNIAGPATVFICLSTHYFLSLAAIYFDGSISGHLQAGLLCLSLNASDYRWVSLTACRQSGGHCCPITTKILPRSFYELPGHGGCDEKF